VKKLANQMKHRNNEREHGRVGNIPELVTLLLLLLRQHQLPNEQEERRLSWNHDLIATITAFAVHYINGVYIISTQYQGSFCIVCV
jgi:hypothetical protein